MGQKNEIILIYQANLKHEVQNDLSTEVGHSGLNFRLKLKCPTDVQILLQVGIYPHACFYRHISRGRRKSENNFDFDFTDS